MEFIARLTDEQVEIIRHQTKYSRAAKVLIRQDMWRQAMAAIKLADQAIAAAAKASGD